MAPLGALSQSWIAAEASLPHGWHISGLWRFEDLWVALSEGPTFDDYLSGSGRYADQALRRMANRLRERRGSAAARASADVRITATKYLANLEGTTGYAAAAAARAEYERLEATLRAAGVPGVSEERVKAIAQQATDRFVATGDLGSALDGILPSRARWPAAS